MVAENRMAAGKTSVLTKTKNFLYENFIIPLSLFIFLVIGLLSPEYYFTWDAISNILVYMTSLLILVIAQAIVIITGNIDLSIIGIAGLSAYIGWLLNVIHGLPAIAVVPLMILTGAGVGFLNGVLVQKVKIPSLVLTLAIMFILYGSLLVATRGTSLGGFSRDYVWLGTALFCGVRVLILILLPLICMVGFYLLHLSKIGRRLFFVGGNPKAASLLGINVDKMVISAFILSGAFSGFAGYVLSSRLGIITTQFGKELLMPAIAAPVIGGVSLTGGEGSFIGILFGTFLIQTISTGLVAAGVSGWYIDIANGILILIAIIVDAVRMRQLTVTET